MLEHVYKRFKLCPTRSYTTLKDYFVRGEFLRRRPKLYIEAIKDVTFSIAKGTVLGIIGPNGAGKSTLLRLIARIYRPSSGRIIVNGRVSAIFNLAVGFHPELSGRENVIIEGLTMGIPRRTIKEKLPEIIDFAELWDFIDAPVRTYSTGMYMRLAFATAICVDPDILLLDEILAVGDASFAQKCFQALDNIKKRRATIIFASHDLQKVQAWCDKVLYLEKGEIKLFGEPERVVRSYCESLSGRE
ncbi:MAG: ABC transporter ATP-binding protein [Candidatus Bipolaricaulaceae bacterium]